MARKKTKAQIKRQLQRFEESINARSSKYPNIPRSAYNLSQQDAWVKSIMRQDPNYNMFARNTERDVRRMFDFADRKEAQRLSQARRAAANLMSKANNGG